MATHYVGKWLATILDLMVAIDAFIASLAGLNRSSRVLFSMGRDRGVPSIFGRSHPRFKSPWIALLFILGLTHILGAWLGRVMNSINGAPLSQQPPAPLPFIEFLAGTATLGILGAYLLAAISGLGFFHRARGKGWQVIWQIVLPLLSTLIVGVTLISSFAPLPPAPPLVAPLSYAPYLFSGWVALGFLLVAVLRNTNPNWYFASRLEYEMPKNWALYLLFR